MIFGNKRRIINMQETDFRAHIFTIFFEICGISIVLKRL